MTSYAAGAGSSHVPVPANLITSDLEGKYKSVNLSLHVVKSFSIVQSVIYIETQCSPIHLTYPGVYSKK